MDCGGKSQEGALPRLRRGTQGHAARLRLHSYSQADVQSIIFKALGTTPGKMDAPIPVSGKQLNELGIAVVEEKDTRISAEQHHNLRNFPTRTTSMPLT